MTNVWDVEDPHGMWSSLGALVHGPVLLATAPGLAVGLRCVTAFPEGLRLWFVAHARDAALVPPNPSPRSEEEAAARSLEWQEFPATPDEPVVHVAADGHRHRLPLWARAGRMAEPGALHTECELRVLGLPADERVTIDVSWGPGLPLTSTTLHLPDLAARADRALPLVQDTGDERIP